MAIESEYILNKARSYCAYQERCVSEVADKLREWKVKPQQAEKLLEMLIHDDYLNEERFARSFAGGKFRINHWGKSKIIHELLKRKVPDLIIQTGLEEIDEAEYEEALKELLSRKIRGIKETDPFKKKQKLIAYAVQKGYHYGIARQFVEEMK